MKKQSKEAAQPVPVEESSAFDDANANARPQPAVATTDDVIADEVSGPESNRQETPAVNLVDSDVTVAATPETGTDEADGEEALAIADDTIDEATEEETTEAAASEEKEVVGPRAADQEFDLLFAQWKATGDPRARERLILMHRNLVTYLTRRFLDRGDLYDDIMQQGLIGLINALDHFDPTRGVRFATFATPTIIGEIRRYFRDKTWTVRVPRRLQELHQVIHRKIDALTQELDRSPTYLEIARSLNIEVEQVIEAQEMSHAMEPASLDEPTSGDGDSAMSVADHLGAPDPALEHWSEHAALHAALERLPQRQQTVLKLAYFEGFSQAEIARRIHVSPMHVSRLQRRALAQLREYLEDSSL